VNHDLDLYISNQNTLLRRYPLYVRESCKMQNVMRLTSLVWVDNDSNETMCTSDCFCLITYAKANMRL
jgi:hypothetical protein